ncbi:MAG TPA: hypothetical protein VH044_12085 [Polyangiaceae bacterium]|jgi:hypothetical protein|nr:hypothetical protein [Polyangiaceae bacterium]
MSAFQSTAPATKPQALGRFLKNQSVARMYEIGTTLASKACMSLLRTMSLIAGGALVALGGSALALFI